MPHTTGISLRGYDLYIKKDGKWLYCTSAAPSNDNLNKEIPLMNSLPDGIKECMLYLPIYSELHSLGIGVEDS